MAEIADTAKTTRAWACYDCGKCTATCPIARAGSNYTPRRHVLATNQRRPEIIDNGSLFDCLTCSLCDQRCPAEVGYSGLVRKLRELAFTEGAEPDCPHGGALQSVMRSMAKGGTQQNRLEWLNQPNPKRKRGPDGSPEATTVALNTTPKQGEVFYWTGCTMYYDAFFTDLQIATLDGTRAAVRLLNKLGVTPVVSPEERCCGHDLLWNGDRKNFELLARHNVKLVADSGAETLVTSCAECLRTWKLDYEPFFEGKPPRILHVTEYLAEHLPKLNFERAVRQRVTFQDPCRLGRHLGIYDPPRRMLAALPGVELVDMRRSGRGAICCAGGTWSNCDRFAKQIQVDRLREVRATGADVLVTACPKCQVHFRCAMKDPNLGDQIEIKMRDVAELVADALEKAEG